MCVQEVSQLELEIHLEAFHSVDTRDLDWTKPLHREVGEDGTPHSVHVIDMLMFAGSSVSHVQAAVFMWVWGWV